MRDMDFERGDFRGRGRCRLRGQTESQACGWLFDEASEAPEVWSSRVLMPSVVNDGFAFAVAQAVVP